MVTTGRITAKSSSSTGVSNDPTKRIGLMAVRALINEVYATPKPGLVDSANSGAHSDMALETFLASARALAPYFTQMACCGYCWEDAPTQLFPSLRNIGLDSEKAMLEATGNINTHKGALFSVGTVCGAAGMLYRQKGRISAEELLRFCGEITKPWLEEDFALMESRKPRTNGEKIYAAHRLRGIRGEVADGFPAVREHSLPAFRRMCQAGMGLGYSLSRTLIYLIANVDDTTLLHRGGMEGLVWAKEQAQKELDRNELYGSYQRLQELDREFTSRNLSPGGCADLLAVTLLADILETV